MIALIIADATSFLTLSFRQAFMMMCDEKLMMDDTRKKLEVSTHHYHLHTSKIMHEMFYLWEPGNMYERHLLIQLC